MFHTTFFFLALFGLLPLFGLAATGAPAAAAFWPYSSRILSLKLTKVLIGMTSRDGSSYKIAVIACLTFMDGSPT